MITEPKEAYPLCWPAGYKRTPSYRRHASAFKQTMDRAQNFLRDEIKRLGGTGLIVSTNLRLRTDGGIYAADMNKLIDDPGVAIYFKYKGKDVSMCCDQYSRVWENLYALGKGIEALRGMERWGVSEFLDRAFTGFAALPSTVIVPYLDVWKALGLPGKPATVGEVTEAYRKQALTVHPDRGGSPDAFNQLQQAYRQALSQF
jgi:hypothetical protein